MAHNLELEAEILRRKEGLFSYSESQISFLNTLNQNLLPLEIKLRTEANEEHLNIFILGLPRSGTTLLSQVITHHLNIYCTNNLMARFWMTPLVGAFLSKIILGERKAKDFQSVFGKTADISSPHEFSWFWQEQMKINNFHNLNIQKKLLEIDWDGFKSVIFNMNKIMEGGIVFKPLEYAGYFLDGFDKNFNKKIFLYIDRDSADISFSLAKARLDYYKDINVMWGSVPPDFDTLKDLPFGEQIAGQIFHLRNMYLDNLKKVDPVQVIRITYKNLCKNPQLVLDKIISLSQNIFNYSVQQLNLPPNNFPFPENKNRLNKDIQNELLEGLKIFEL